MKTPTIALGLLCAALGTAHAQTILDDFNGTTIDTSKWTPSAYSSGSAVVSAGQLTLTSKGRITSVAQYPAGLSLEGRFTISGATSDQLSFVLRSDGTFSGPFGESANGIFIQFNTSQNPDGYNEVRINDVSGARGYIAQLRTTLNRGTEYAFKIVDSGTNIAVYLGSLATPVLSAAATSRTGNRFSIYNRELGGCVTSLNTLTATAIPQLSLSVRVSQVDLCWESIASTVYQVQYRSTLTTNLWSPLVAGVVGTGARICLSVPVAADQSQRFFQVVAQTGQ